LSDLILTSDELSTVKRILYSQELVIALKNEWGSQQAGHSDLIHKDLDSQVRPGDGSSISHTTGIGGYVIVRTSPPWRVGFDLEVIARVTPAVARRVSYSKEEFSNAPSSESLWTAKEAAYKALKGPSQPSVVTELHIGSWDTFDSQIETFRLENLQAFEFSVGYGLVFKKFPYCFSIFVCRP
jgi:4'-phosphopantetheinyl transferase